MIFSDISKAFDKVFDGGILSKRESFWCYGKLLSCFKSYLHVENSLLLLMSLLLKLNQPAQVYLKDPYWDLFYFCYLSTIFQIKPKSDTFMFAYDTSLVRTLSNPYADIQLATAELRQLSKWARQWKATFNVQKAVYMIFTNKDALQ